MNEKPNKLEREIDGLRERYQSLQAPSHLQSRILAHANSENTGARRWRPALVAIPLALAVFGILPFIGQQETESSISPRLPSLNALAQLKPARPATVAPSLGRIRTVSAPPMPKKPKAEVVVDPQTNFERDNLQNPQEYKYEYV